MKKQTKNLNILVVLSIFLSNSLAQENTKAKVSTTQLNWDATKGFKQMKAKIKCILGKKQKASEKMKELIETLESSPIATLFKGDQTSKPIDDEFKADFKNIDKLFIQQTKPKLSLRATHKKIRRQRKILRTMRRSLRQCNRLKYPRFEFKSEANFRRCLIMVLSKLQKYYDEWVKHHDLLSEIANQAVSGLNDLAKQIGILKSKKEVLKKEGIKKLKVRFKGYAKKGNLVQRLARRKFKLLRKSHRNMKIMQRLIGRIKNKLQRSERSINRRHRRLRRKVANLKFKLRKSRTKCRQHRMHIRRIKQITKTKLNSLKKNRNARMVKLLDKLQKHKRLHEKHKLAVKRCRNRLKNHRKMINRLKAIKLPVAINHALKQLKKLRLMSRVFRANKSRMKASIRKGVNWSFGHAQQFINKLRSRYFRHHWHRGRTLMGVGGIGETHGVNLPGFDEFLQKIGDLDQKDKAVIEVCFNQ